MPDAILNAVDTQPGNNRSEWVCQAIRIRLDMERVADGHDLPDEWWLDAAEMYVEAVDSEPETIEA